MREPTAADWDAGHEDARRRNEELLQPLNAHGHWRKVDRPPEGYDGPWVRTTHFTGFSGSYQTKAPGDFYIWDDAPAEKG